MEIKASCAYDSKAVKALVHLGIYKKSNPKTRFILSIVFLLITITLAILNLIFPETPLNSVSSTSIWILLIGATIFTALSFHLYFGLPKIQYKNLHKLGNLENTYTFTENDFSCVSSHTDYNGSATLKYSVIFKIVETSKYMFIFRDKAQAFVIDKSTFKNGTPEDIRRLLKNYLGDKYIICNY